MNEQRTDESRFTKWLGEKDHRKFFIMGMLLVGGYLLLVPGGSAKMNNQPEKEMQAQDIVKYEISLEQRLTELIESVDGAGKARVMVTLESAQKNIYATDTRNSMGGTDQTHILLDEGGALTETIETPEIGGVAVLCEGGDNVKVVAQIHEILSSLLGLSTGRISVTKMSK